MATTTNPVIATPELRSGGDKMWRATLRLRKAHWRSLEDIADAIRKAGSNQQRPSHSEIIATVLDVVLPVVTDMDFGVKNPNADVEPTVTSARIRDTLAARLSGL